MDDTRDIAIGAQSSAASAHHRLDKMNGSIDRLGNEAEELRRETTAGFVKLTDDLAHGLLRLVGEAGQTKTELASIKSTVKTWATILASAWAIVAGVAVYVLTHPHIVRSQPPQAQQIAPK